MIIECTNCNKKFNVDINLIPENGRQIQCGSCNYVWFYKVEKLSSDTLILDKENDELEEKVKNIEENILDNHAKNINTNEVKISKTEDYNNFKSQKKIKTNIISKFFSYLIVFIISLLAIIIFLDTFKSTLINIFPFLEIILFNFFETLKDIKLFIIDLT